MPIISKELFYGLSSPELTCVQFLHHSTDSCFKAMFDLILETAIGSSKFFLLIYVLQSITKWKKINKQFVKKQINAYLRSIMYGLCYAANFSSSSCLMRKCMDEFYFYSIALSGACGGLAIFVESQENRSLNTAIFTNLVAETTLRYLYWRNLVSRTAIKETFLFMTCSAMLMYLLKTQKTGNKITNLWFYHPSRIKPESKHTKTAQICTHQTSCYNYVYEGFATYFVVGYVLQLLKYLIPRINTIIFNPLGMSKAVLCKDKLLFGLLLGSYVGIYRIVSCVLRRRDKKEKPFHAVVAGLLAGSSYIFKPTIPIVSIAITTTLQLLIQRITYINDLQSKLPTREIIFSLCSGILFHSRFFLPDSCPKYVKTVLTTATNGKVNEIYEHALQLMGENLTKSASS